MNNFTKIRPKYGSNGSLTEKFNEFYDKYYNLYTPDQWVFIKDYFFSSINDSCVPLIVMQIYSELGIDAKSLEVYRNHFNKLKKHFSLSRNIIDIGGGFLPAFANMIAEEQYKIGTGTITVYDPALVVTEPKYSNMTLIKDEFTTDTDVSNYDLMLGLFPCEATRSIVESAKKNNKDFYVAECGCGHAVNPYYYFDKDSDNIELEYFDGTEYDYPILIRKRN